MNSAKTIWVHAGMSKTGTTSVQKMLANNQQILSQEGILYPASARKNGIGHHSLAAYIKQNRDGDEAEKLQNEINETQHKTVIVSSELLERMSPEKWESLKRFFSPHQVKIIYYLRRQDDAIVSMYNELVKKHAVNLDFTTYLSSSPRVDLLDYRKTLAVIEGVFGIENMSLGIFSKETLSSGNIGKDFIKRILPKLEENEAFQAPHDNTSLSPASAMLMARVNKQVNFDIDHSKYYGPACKLAEIVNRTVKKSTSVKHDYFESSLQRKEFLEKFSTSNQFISDRYLKGQSFIQNSSTSELRLLSEAEESVLLETVLAELIKRRCSNKDKRDGLAKAIGILWQDELKQLISN